MDHGARPDADHHVVRLVVGAFQEVDIVGRHQSQSEVIGDPDQASAVAPLLVDPVVGQFDEEVLLAEEIAVGGGVLKGLLGLSRGEGHVDLPLETAAQGYQPLAVAREEFPVDAWLVVEAVEMGRRTEFHQIPVPLVVGGKQGHVEGDILAAVSRLFLVHRAGGDIDLAPDDGLHLCLLRRLIKLDRPEEVAVVGQGDGRHPELRRLADELIHPDRPVQQRVLAVDMEMDERRLGHPVNLRLPIPTGKGRVERFIQSKRILIWNSGSQEMGR